MQSRRDLRNDMDAPAHGVSKITNWVHRGREMAPLSYSIRAAGRGMEYRAREVAPPSSLLSSLN